jgi:hypothetical protein
MGELFLLQGCCFVILIAVFGIGLCYVLTRKSGKSPDQS